MTQLFLDTSSHNLIIGLYKNGIELFKIIEPSNNKISDLLLSKIDCALKKASLKIEEIDEIYIVVGPGSFTGIRIGVTFAKIAAYSLNIKVIPISELELLTSGSTSKYILSLVDARRGYVYAGMYDNEGNSILKDQYIFLDDLIANLKSNYDINNIKIVSYDKFNLIDTFEPVLNINKIIKKHEKDNAINPHLLNPNYLKKTEAEEKLNDKRS